MEITSKSLPLQECSMHVSPQHAGTNRISHAIQGAHEGGIFTLCMLRCGTLVSGGGKDRKLISWDRNYQKLEVVEVRHAKITCTSKRINSVCSCVKVMEFWLAFDLRWKIYICVAQGGYLLSFISCYSFMCFTLAFPFFYVEQAKGCFCN